MTQTSFKLLRRLPLIGLLMATGLGFWLFSDWLTLDRFAQNLDQIRVFKSQNPVLMVAAYILTYVIIVALSLPGALVITLTGGVIFGLFPGVLYSVIGATIGATIVFIAARLGIGVDVEKRLTQGGGRVTALMKALADNQISTLMVMRLAPVVPFFVANLIPAFVGVRTRVFIGTTFFGIIPGSFVFTSVGAGLTSVLAQGRTPDLATLTDPGLLLPLAGLALLSAIPLVVNLVKKRSHGNL